MLYKLLEDLSTDWVRTLNQQQVLRQLAGDLNNKLAELFNQKVAS